MHSLLVVIGFSFFIAMAALVVPLGSAFAQTGTITNVRITPDAQNLGDQAFRPSPMLIGVGDTVTWRNDDSTPHRITSGDGPSDPNFGAVFDSGMLGPKRTFSHTFDSQGEFPYFCQIHPTMTGLISVVEAAALTQPETPANSTADADTETVTETNTMMAANDTTIIIETAKEQYLEAWNQSEFHSAFDTYIVEGTAMGYGAYVPRESNVFSPGEAIVLYVEPVGFTHLPFAEDNRTVYLMNFTADISIRSGNQTELQSITDIPVTTVVSFRPNTELFLELTLNQETAFPDGEYMISYTITDEPSGESFEIIKEIRVSSTNSVSGGNTRAGSGIFLLDNNNSRNPVTGSSNPGSNSNFT